MTRFVSLSYKRVVLYSSQYSISQKLTFCVSKSFHLLIQFMKNGTKNKSVAFIFLFSVIVWLQDCSLVLVYHYCPFSCSNFDVLWEIISILFSFFHVFIFLFSFLCQQLRYEVTSQQAPGHSVYSVNRFRLLEERNRTLKLELATLRQEKQQYRKLVKLLLRCYLPAYKLNIYNPSLELKL